MAKASKLAWGIFAVVLLLSSQVVRSEDADDSTDEDDEYEDVHRAHLILRKSLNEDSVVQGRNVTVTLNLFNTGSLSARTVKLVDVLPDNARLVDGSLQITFPIIAEGSSAQHSYVMSFTSGGDSQVLPLATVSYMAEDKSQQIGYSSTFGCYVMTPVQQIQRIGLEVGKYASLGMATNFSHWRNIIIVASLVSLMLGGNWLYKATNKASVSRKRHRALQELEKSE